MIPGGRCLLLLDLNLLGLGFLGLGFLRFSLLRLSFLGLSFLGLCLLGCYLLDWFDRLHSLDRLHYHRLCYLLRSRHLSLLIDVAVLPLNLHGLVGVRT
jgi:hypothetical protein